MLRCQNSHQFQRIHRKLWQRLVYTAMYECATCSIRRMEPRRYTFRFGMKVRCPECGGRRLHHLARRDQVERVSRHPWNMLQGLLGGKLYYCPLCRLQFHDWRERARDQQARAAAR